MEKYYVTFVSENKKGNYVEVDEEARDMIEVARMMLTFKPKKGYEVFQVSVIKVNTLI